MRIVIVGAGKVGSTLADQLTREGHDIIVIDNDRDVVRRLSDELDVLTVYGNGASLDVQRDADVEDSDLLIAVTSQDELNLMCCILARKLGCQNTIARVRNPEYAQQSYFLKDELGLSMIVNPEWTAAREVFRLMQFPAFMKRDSFAKGRVDIVELLIKEGGFLDGVVLRELHKKMSIRVLVCAVQRDSEVFIPDGNFRLEAGDKIYVTAQTTDLVELTKIIGEKNYKAKNVLIIGGSRIAEYLTHMLLKTGTHVKIIEKDYERSMFLAETFPEATIINGDGSSQEVLKAENAAQADTLITLTNIDEENLIISFYANHIGVPQVITKVNRTEYIELFQNKGIDRAFSPKLMCADNIVRYVRAMQNTEGSSILSLHHLVNGQVHALECNVTEKTLNLGKTLAEIQLKQNLLVACINRMGKIIIPSGKDTLRVRDTVVVVTATDRVILDLNDIFVQEV
ncbi:MAG: Trk system potassium transporter TrkA [Oscillospiraceae bacterium]|jgi:trk system potassium uptake protein TrkA